MSTEDEILSAELHGEALLAAKRPELQPLIDHLRDVAQGQVRMELAGPLGTAPSSAVTSPVEAVHDLYESHYRRLVRLATMLLGDVEPQQRRVHADPLRRPLRGWFGGGGGPSGRAAGKRLEGLRQRASAGHPEPEVSPGRVPEPILRAGPHRQKHSELAFRLVRGILRGWA